MKLRKIIIGVSIPIIILVSSIGTESELVENLAIPVGVGLDIEKHGEYTTYISPSSIYYFEEEKITNVVLSGKGSDIAETRETRHVKSPKKTLIGLNRIFLLSEDTASNGLHDYIDINLNNSLINDRAVVVVCKGKAEDMFKFHLEGYSSSAEFIYGMVNSLKQYLFFPTQYSLIDLIVRFDAEGRNALLPYIEIKDKSIETTGLAIFKGDKMIGKTNIDEAKIINFLKEDNVKGILTLEKKPQKNIDSYTYSKKKVKCSKKNGKYIFTINLDMKGNILSNQLYGDLYSNVNTLNNYQKEMEKYVEKISNIEIQKIKTEYKTDVLGLGKYAAAKYGRGTRTDWNKVFCESTVIVNVKFTVDTEGRGNY